MLFLLVVMLPILISAYFVLPTFLQFFFTFLPAFYRISQVRRWSKFHLVNASRSRILLQSSLKMVLADK